MLTYKSVWMELVDNWQMFKILVDNWRMAKFVLVDNWQMGRQKGHSRMVK
jgi:hypothetical protein